MTLALLGAAVFLVAFAISAVATPLARGLALRLGLLDSPGGRKAHERPTPLLGGAAILAGFALPIAGGIALLAFAGDRLPLADRIPGFAAERAHALGEAPRALFLLFGALIVFAVGLLDDRRKTTFPVPAKLAGQVLGALVLVASGARLDLFGHGVPNAAASVVWVVSVANAFNLLDHADGVASGVALISTALFAAVAIAQQQYLIALALAALGGSLAGFLPYNFPPASIFLGDAGSLTIGYALGALTLLESYVTSASPGLLPVLLPPIVLGIPLFDMAAVVAARIFAGRPFYEGDRNHLHHRLSRLGMSPRQATLAVYLAAFALGAGALALPFVSAAVAIVIFAQSLAVFGLLAALMFFGDKAGRA